MTIITALYCFIFVLGLLIGSFLNMVIVRLSGFPAWRTKRSVCPKCEQLIHWYDNIPIVSFLLLRAKCRRCKAKISWQYPVVELSCALLFLFWFWLFGISGKTISLMVFSVFLLVIFVYDFKYYLILDSVTIPAMIIAFLLNWLVNDLPAGYLLFSGAIGAGFFAFQYFGSYAIGWHKNYRVGQKSDIQTWVGDGDIRLGGLMGLMLGWPLLLVALFVAYVIGAAVGLGLMAAQKKQLSSMIPFGPFLVIGTLVSLAFGNKIIIWYMGLLRL